jgi:beta-mannosidase
MFSCAEYPEDQEWFLDEVRKEIDYQTRILRNHPSLALWCGNNENQQIYWKYTHYAGEYIYNYTAPEIVHKNSPHIFYWNSSAYGGKTPNSEVVGDRHNWRTCFMSEEMICRIRPEEFDKAKAKFISEYGYISPPRKSSVIRYLDGAPFDVQGEVWQHHNNKFEKDTVLAGIKYHYGDCLNDAGGKLDVDKYLIYAGLCQGVMYDYSLESFRARPECSGGLFWMYNDCWGETGWTIIDYYLIRKISYYYVKRAFEPVKLILKEEKAGTAGASKSITGTTGAGDGSKSSDGGNVGIILKPVPDISPESAFELASVGCPVAVTAINETDRMKELEIEYGYVSYDGTFKDTERSGFCLPPYSRGVALKFRQKGYDTVKGVYFARIVGGMPGYSSAAACLRKHSYCKLEMPDAGVSITAVDYSGNSVVLTVSTRAYAHAVHFNLPDKIKLSDEYFDMLPGESRVITVFDYFKGGRSHRDPADSAGLMDAAGLNGIAGLKAYAINQK